MNITYLQRDKIDANKWDKCVESNLETANLSAMSWYLDICCKDWGALIIDDYRSVIPLPYRKKHGIEYVYPPFFAHKLGFLGDELTQAETEKAIDWIAKNYKWADLIFTSNIYYKRGKTILHQASLLDLRPDYETILKKYHSINRENSQRAKKENLKLIFDIEPKKIIELFKNNRGKDASVGYQDSDYDNLANVITLLQERKAVEVVGVFNADGVLCAGAFFTISAKRYHLSFSARNVEIKSKCLYFLIDNFIFRHAGEDMFLDFIGSDNPNIAKFYAGFGSKEYTFTQLTINNLNILQQFALSIYRKLR